MHITFAQCGFHVTFKVDIGEDARRFAQKYAKTPRECQDTIKQLSSMQTGECFIEGPLINQETGNPLVGPKRVTVEDNDQDF